MEKDLHPLNGTTRETYYFDILKIALALAVIRTKPQHITAKIYSQLIATKLINNEIKLKSKAKTLEEELLLVKEELLQVKLSLHNNVPQTTTEDTDAAIAGQDVTSELDSSSMECLTPPCSSESTSSEKQNVESQNKHKEFLKSIVALRDAPQTAEMLANSDMRATIISTVLQAVSVLRDGVNDQFIKTSIPEFCVEALLGVLDMEIPNTGSSKVTERVLEYVEGMIQATMNHKLGENNVPQEKYSKLILRLACHEKTTELVLSKLIDVLKDFSRTLRAISREPAMLGDNLVTYKNIYYILCCIENILTRRLEYSLAESVSISLMESLEDSVLHLSKTFPLFTQWVWRIGGLISRTKKQEMETG